MPDPDRPAEAVLASWNADKATYFRGNVTLAVLCSIAAFAVLVVMGNPDPWVGPVGVVLALGVRGVYLASEEIGVRWDLTKHRLVSSSGKKISLSEIDRVRTLGTAVQVITRGGDKHLLKHLRDPEDARAVIARAAGMETA